MRNIGFIVMAVVIMLAGCAKEAVKDEPVVPRETEDIQAPADASPSRTESTVPDRPVAVEDAGKAAESGDEPASTPEKAPEQPVEESPVTVVETESTGGGTGMASAEKKEPEPETITHRPAEEEAVIDSVAVLYMIRPGDYLAKIAYNEYGRYNLWRKIWRWNYDMIGDNPALIFPYNELTLRKPKEVANPVSYNFYDYAVKPGENLWNIAKREYGNNYAWIVILRDNFDKIGSDYDDIEPGTVLQIRTRLH